MPCHIHLYDCNLRLITKNACALVRDCGGDDDDGWLHMLQWYVGNQMNSHLIDDSCRTNGLEREVDWFYGWTITAFDIRIFHLSERSSLHLYGQNWNVCVSNLAQAHAITKNDDEKCSTANNESKWTEPSVRPIPRHWSSSFSVCSNAKCKTKTGTTSRIDDNKHMKSHVSCLSKDIHINKPTNNNHFVPMAKFSCYSVHGMAKFRSWEIAKRKNGKQEKPTVCACSSTSSTALPEKGFFIILVNGNCCC